jgi:uncharacterized protein YaiI (UPF0178 family)
MTIWVDADACPRVIKEILYRAAQRTGVSLVLVANHALRVPRSPLVRAVQVPSGFDQADAWIAGQVGPGDLVITADIPLAADVIGHGALALSPRGELFSEDNVRQRLVMRDLMDELRGTGMDVGGGPPPLGPQDRHAFAAALDRLLARSQPRAGSSR